MTVKIKVLEHHANILANAIEIGCGSGEVFTVYQDRACARFFEPVATAKQRAFTGARRPDHENQLSFVDTQVDALEDLEDGRSVTSNLEADEALLAEVMG
jgi:hypothetical protein